jgi:hypothetical protein
MNSGQAGTRSSAAPGEAGKQAAQSTYGPDQLAGFLGLWRWQLDRALAAGLIPAPDKPRGKWSRQIAENAAAHISDIRAAAGTVPDLGAVRAAETLSERLGTPVSSDGMAELGRRGLIPVTGYYKGFALYDGRALETFTDAAAAAEANRTGQLRTADQSARYLGIRRADLDHLTRAGLLTEAGRAHGPYDRRSTYSVPLYRTADLDDLAARPGIDWDTVRATPKGRRSPLAALPGAPGRPARRRRRTWQDGPDAYRSRPQDGTAASTGGGDPGHDP